MTQTCEEHHAEIAAALPPLIRQTLHAYEAFAAQAPPADAKEFGGFHTACKAALAHLDTLLKLERSLSEPAEAEAGTGETKGEDLAARVREARAALHRMRAGA